MSDNENHNDSTNDNNAAKRQRLTPEPGTSTRNNTPFVSPNGSVTDITKTDQIVLTDHCLVYYRTLRKIQKGLLKASHHANIMSQYVERGTTPRGLQANVTTQIPEISTYFQMRWERAHIDFANALTNLLRESWTTRTADLTTRKEELLAEAVTTCKNNEIPEINLQLSKITLNPITVNKSERKVEDTRNRQFLRVPPGTQSSTSVKRR